MDDTPIIPMNQIYYNFVRGYQALKGFKPAEMVGIGVEGGSNWMGLIKIASQKIGVINSIYQFYIFGLILF